MDHDEFTTALATAHQVLGPSAVVVIGSQSLLGSCDARSLPAVAAGARGCDLLVEDSRWSGAHERVHELEALVGQWSPFDVARGNHVCGYVIEEIALPADWRSRLMPWGVDLCLDPHDLCAAALIAGRSKDRTLVHELLELALVDTRVVTSRLLATDARHSGRLLLALDWLSDPRPA